MAQSPFKVDGLQVEPGSGQNLLIERDAATGSLKFTDNVVSGGILLSQLAGIQAIGNVYVVGKSGAGAEYTTIQGALDAVPSTSSSSNPYTVVVLPGVYEETLNLVRDGVRLIGIGQPVIQEGAANDDHTLIISAQLGTTPLSGMVQGFRITNEHNNRACVRVVGAAASTLLSDTFTLKDCVLYAEAPGGNRPLWASTANYLEVVDCSCSGNSQALVVLEEMADVRVVGTRFTCAVSSRYDTANDEPATLSGALSLSNCPRIGEGTVLAPAFYVDADGRGSLDMLNSSMSSSSRLQFSGDQQHTILASVLDELSVTETSDVRLTQVSFGNLLAANPAAVLQRDNDVGTEAFAASATASVVLDIPQPDTNYSVQLEVDDRPGNDETPWVSNKLATGFDINFNTVQTLNVRWRVER